MVLDHCIYATKVPEAEYYMQAKVFSLATAAIPTPSLIM